MQTSRLLLRPFELSDASEVQRMVRAKEIAQTTLAIPHPYPDGASEAWILGHGANWEKGVGVEFAVVEKEFMRLVGAIGLVISVAHKKAELGYWIGTEYWNRGYSTEAAKAVVEFTFVELGINKIIARHFSGNPASGRVMQKIGMVQEGLLRRDILKDGIFYDVILYGLLNPKS